MNKFLSVAAVLLFLVVGAGRADSIVDVNATNFEFFASAIVPPKVLDTVNISLQLDVTTLTVVPGTATVTFSGGLAGTAFALTPGGFFSATDALFNWTDANGDVIEFGVDDYSCAFNLGCPLFPSVGSYIPAIILVQCGNSVNPNNTCSKDLGGLVFGGAGTVSVTAAPEPGTFVLLALGLLSLLIARRKVIRSSQPSP